MQRQLPRQRLCCEETGQRLMARKGYVHPSCRSGPYCPSRGAFAGQKFKSYRAFQNAHAQAKGFGSAAKRLAMPQRVGAKAGIKALARPSRVRALDALSRMRKGASIGKAARESDTTIATVKRYVASALRKGNGGRILASRSDRMTAYMEVPDSHRQQVHARNRITIAPPPKCLLGSGA